MGKSLKPAALESAPRTGGTPAVFLDRGGTINEEVGYVNHLEAYRVGCRCRKPSTGMLEGAAQRFQIDLASSYVVGDSYRDMQLGFNAGARTILVLTGS